MKMPGSAIVMAAGMGDRMKPLTLERPKPMLLLKGRPLIDYALDHLARVGIGTVIVNLHYKGEMIRDHLSSRIDPPIVFQSEETLLDTGGSALRALSRLGPKPFFALNADTVYIDGPVSALRRLAEFWNEDAMDALLLLVPTGGSAAGDYTPDADGRLSYRPDGNTATHGFAAVSLLHPRLFDSPPDGAFSLKVLWDRAERAGRLFGLVHDGACHHLSTPADLRRSNELLA